jgi:hypothetical protein
MASSSQSSWQTSTSEPIAVSTRENDLIDQLSGVAAGLAQQMNQWAQGVFAQTSQVTNQAVGNFFQVSQRMMGLSTTLTDQYNNLFAPQNRQLVAEANSYNSAARQKVDMGMAGATQAQAGDAALRSSEEALRSYGIDPSSGRYAALDKAAAVQNSANVAGAMNLQRDRTAQIGRDLRTQAVQVGAQLPAAIANVNNTAIQANTGASNASLANANTGANLQRLANEYLKTAMDIKLPPVGQKSQGQGGGSGFSSSPSGGGGGGGRSAGGGSPGGGGAGGSQGGGGGGPAWMPQHTGGQEQLGAGGGQVASIRPGSAARIMNIPGGGDDNSAWWNQQSQGYDPWGSVTGDEFAGGNDWLSQNYAPEQDQYGNDYSMGIGQEGTNENIWGGDFGVGNNPFNDTGFGQTYDYGGPDQTFGGIGDYANTQYGDISYDAASNNYDPGWAQTYDQPNPSTDWGSGGAAYQDYGAGAGYDTSSPTSDYYAGDYGGTTADDWAGAAYAKGGPVPGSGGGAVPRAMSPSGGQRVDDVRAQMPSGAPARLNANEFVVPQDVALWKGQEFFQNLIAQSRKKRVTAPAQPSAPGASRQPMMR